MAGERAGRLRPSSEREYRLVKPIIRLVSWANTGIFQATGGRLGSRFLRGAPVGLLTTTGRKSGRRRTTPLIYLEDGGRIVLVASQGGLPHHPAWFLNLLADPSASFQIGRELRGFRARRASDAEKRELWPRLCAVYPDYDDYQRRTDREIPVVILEPGAA